MIYVTKKDETILELASQFKITVSSLIASNPSIEFNRSLKPNECVAIPEALPSIICPEKYTYEQMVDDIIVLKSRYPFVQVSLIGQSVLGRVIPVIKLGNGTLKIFCNGSHHAREWITSPLLMKFIESYSLSFVNGKPLYDYSILNIFSNCTIWLAPMVNPDGVNLAIKGLSEDNSFVFDLFKVNNNNPDFSTWKANINGVDLNRNYDADWDQYKSLEPSLGITGPSSAGYGGLFPESEPETQAMVTYTRSINPHLVLAFHAQGEEIYWNYNGMKASKSYKLAKELSKVSGYTLTEPDESGTLYAGYKDWFIKEFNYPGFTIEVGKEITPVPISQFEEIVEKNFKIILKATEFQV